MQPQPSDGPKRLPFIDAMRGLAVLLMIAVHTTDVFLAMPFREGDVWSRIDILFGFVAPAFLFFSGVTLYLAVVRRRESGRTVSDLVVRALLILALGYWLHIPAHSLRRALEASRAQVVRFFDSDVLHVIALSMLLVLGLVAFVRLPRRAGLPILLLGVAIAAITPVVWDAGFVDSLPLAISQFAGPPGTFPLFPYAAYVLTGFGASALLLAARRREFGPLAVGSVGIGLIFTSYLLNLVLSSLPSYDSFWHGSPALVLFRLGGIVLATAGIMWLESAEKNMTWLERIGRASLAIYVLHLMLVYGSPITMGMTYWFDGMLRRAFDPLGTAVLFIAVTVVTLFAVDLWGWFRERSPAWSRRLFWGWWIAFGLFFLLVG